MAIIDENSLESQTILAKKDKFSENAAKSQKGLAFSGKQCIIIDIT